MYYNGARAAVVVYDGNNLSSFSAMKEWVLELQKQVDAEDVIVVLVENKNDLECKVSEEDKSKFAEELNAPIFSTSAKTGDGIDKVFEYIALQIFSEHKSDSDSDTIDPTSPIPPSEPENINLTESSHKSKGKCCK